MAATDTTAANELLAVRAAELYYEENKTQDEIGAILRVTRWKVGRLLQQARDRGIIRIEIVHPRARRLSLERELTASFDARRELAVSPSAGSPRISARARREPRRELAASPGANLP